MKSGRRGLSWLALILMSACSSARDLPPEPEMDPPSSGGTDASGGSASATGGAPAAGGVTSVGGGAVQPSGGQWNEASGGAPVGAGGADAGSGGAEQEDLPPLTIFLAGDSTVSTYADTPSPTDQAGWGQMLGAWFDERVTVDNRAIGGRTARRFIDDGALEAIWADAQPGDHLFVQFGTNDSNKTASYELDGTSVPYYLDPAADFPTYLMEYVQGARERGVTPVLVTPPPRNSAYCTGGNGTGAHAQAMRDLGAKEKIPVLDLNERTVSHLKAICPAPSPEDFFLVRGDGSVDGTHFQENGARSLASFVVLELAATELPLTQYVQD